ncbi:MAG: tyrosine-type recombinase/integrase [Chloroflexi bacterium]|nr:tyrosine-type recombinase/integrase [Chloroflexota bacterium]
MLRPLAHLRGALRGAGDAAPATPVRSLPSVARGSCATLLLNAGAPILTVQTILGHKHIDTTLGYARLYDGTLAADYYRAMREVESRLALGESTVDPPTSGELLALVDTLGTGTLNDAQREVVQALRAAILALGEGEE